MDRIQKLYPSTPSFEEWAELPGEKEYSSGTTDEMVYFLRKSSAAAGASAPVGRRDVSGVLP
jgi:hypothetical protein